MVDAERLTIELNRIHKMAEERAVADPTPEVIQEARGIQSAVRWISAWVDKEIGLRSIG